ncbi:MAG: winged helix-turn-helix domain-containing protein [Bacteroidales bacterium]|nr:winged helix-turn-helix domain-containing protein [Bacteroidales bacterium]
MNKEMTLHEAIVTVIKDARRPLTFEEIAEAINQAKLYSKRDGNSAPAKQIRTRIAKYNSYFEVTTINGVKYVNSK